MIFSSFEFLFPDDLIVVKCWFVNLYVNLTVKINLVKMQTNSQMNESLYHQFQILGAYERGIIVQKSQIHNFDNNNKATAYAST